MLYIKFYDILYFKKTMVIIFPANKKGLMKYYTK